jgi:hypothetical protein
MVPSGLMALSSSAFGCREAPRAARLAEAEAAAEAAAEAMSWETGLHTGLAPLSAGRSSQAVARAKQQGVPRVPDSQRCSESERRDLRSEQASRPAGRLGSMVCR